VRLRGERVSALRSDRSCRLRGSIRRSPPRVWCAAAGETARLGGAGPRCAYCAFRGLPCSTSTLRCAASSRRSRPRRTSTSRRLNERILDEHAAGVGLTDGPQKCPHRQTEPAPVGKLAGGGAGLAGGRGSVGATDVPVLVYPLNQQRRGSEVKAREFPDVPPGVSLLGSSEHESIASGTRCGSAGVGRSPANVASG
jgi:hypothetical protein